MFDSMAGGKGGDRIEIRASGFSVASWYVSEPNWRNHSGAEQARAFLTVGNGLRDRISNAFLAENLQVSGETGAAISRSSLISSQHGFDGRALIATLLC